MNKINFNVPFFDVTGKEVPNKKLSSVLSEYIGTNTKHPQKVKLYGWYKALMNGEELNLDDADMDILKEILLKNEDMFAFVVGQINEVLKNSK